MFSKHLSIKQLSIRNRLLLAASVWLSSMLILAAFLIPQFVDRYLRETAVGQLQLTAQHIKENLVLTAEGELTLEGGLASPVFKHPQSPMYWQVTGNGYLLRALTLKDQSITLGSELNSLSDTGNLSGPAGENLLYVKQQVIHPDIAEPLTLVVGIDEDPIEYTVHTIIGIIGIIFALIFVGLLIATVVQVQWSLRPLGQLRAELQALSQGEQDHINAGYPDEVSLLVSDLNALLFHYQELLQRARNLSGNLSHSIKTPLTALNNCIAQLPEAERQEMAEYIRQVLDQIDYHLGRGRVAGAANILAVSARPCERIDAISRAFDKVYACRELVLVNEIEQEVAVAVEQTDLDEMLGNLVENAYKWSKSIIRVHAQSEHDKVAIFIEDNGPGIAEEQRDNIIQRGFRLDETTPGSGLGLHIVSEIAHSYRGSLAFEQSRLGGLRAILTLQAVSKGGQ